MPSSGPTRVLHYLSSLHISAGMARVVFNYQQHLDPRRVQFDYLIMNDYVPSLQSQVEAMGSKVYVRPFKGAGLPGAAVRSFFAEHESEYDILHCHQVFGPQIAGRAARKHGVGHVIAHSHSTKFSDKSNSARRNKFLSKFVGLCATDYIACAEDARVLLGSHGAEATILHNAVDCEKFAFDSSARARIRAEFGVRDDCLLVGTLGRLAPEKNQTFLVDVAAGLRGAGVPFKMIVAGEGKLRAPLEQKVRDTNLDDCVVLCGARDDAAALYSGFDVFVLPSLFEGLPVSAVEAQVSGLPCFLSDTITSEALFGDGMRLSIAHGPTSWVGAIADAGFTSEKCRKRGVENARISHFDIATEADRLAQYYEQLAQK